MAALQKILRRVGLALRRRGVLDQDIEDLVQDAYVRLEQYSADQSVREPEAFLVRAAYNLAVDAGRRRTRSPVVDTELDFDVADDAPRPDEAWGSKQRIEQLKRAFDALDPLTAQMLRAQRLEGLRVDEIARYHGLTKSAVEKRLAKGMVFLTRWMGEQ
ncbi:MAG: sigma-70 family RNA polymerase sigma factor [Pseudomonadota bacterium]|uniref:RNA polymerase sigma factor n=1 Tax=Sphingomonas sp. ERG5 TaxID=1381597 RepID=UPI00054C4916|nr:sigma-70 family RNA polymerase sigma factor [Sphingomonas sp. ERG5]